MPVLLILCRLEQSFYSPWIFYIISLLHFGGNTNAHSLYHTHRHNVNLLLRCFTVLFWFFFLLEFICVK